MKGIQQLLVAALIALVPVGPVLADPFIEGSDEASSRFHGHLDDFGRALGESGQRMRESYDYSAAQQAQRNLADQQAIQQGTQAVSQQEFQNGLIQAQSSGGLYNGNGGGFINNGGLFGSGIGVFGLPGVPTSGYQPSYSSVNQSTNMSGGAYPAAPPSSPAITNGGLFQNDFFGDSSTNYTHHHLSNDKRSSDPVWKEPVSTLKQNNSSSNSSSSSNTATAPRSAPAN